MRNESRVNEMTISISSKYCSIYIYSNDAHNYTVQNDDDHFDFDPNIEGEILRNITVRNDDVDSSFALFAVR